MPFYQNGQNVGGNQYNAEGDIHLGGEQKAEDIAKLLETLKQELATARQQGILDTSTSINPEDMVNKALQQTKEPQPDKKKLLTYLNVAKGLLEDIVSASGAVTSLVHIAEVVQRSF